MLTVEGGRLQAENTDLGYSGRLRLSGRPQGQLKLAGVVDLAVLERHVFRSGLGFAGRARWDGLLSIDGSRLRIEGRMEGSSGASWPSRCRASPPPLLRRDAAGWCCATSR